MEKSIRVAVIDYNDEVICSVKKYFSNHAVISVVCSLNNGEDALDYLINHASDYDLILMDILLPKMDGITLLENLKGRHLNKKVIVISSYKDDYTVKKLVSLDVNYFILKPFCLDSLEGRILELNDNIDIKTNKEASTELKISETLHDLGVPSHIHGYEYIRDGVLMILSNGSYLGFITRDIYPQIAQKYSTTPSRVERAIRHAIEISWDRGDVDLMNKFFGNSVEFDKGKPTNAEYLNTIADRIRLTNNLVVN